MKTKINGNDTNATIKELNVILTSQSIFAILSPTVQVLYLATYVQLLVVRHQHQSI